MAERPLALVTGGARRVGAAIAATLARAGCDLIITCRTGIHDARTLAHTLRTLGAAPSVETLDLADPDAVRAFAHAIARSHQRLDVLVHNASTYDPSPIQELAAPDGPAAAERQWRVNALAPLTLTAALAPLLRRSILPARGAVVALTDIHALGRPRRDHAAYAMSKAALAEMVRSLARDLAPDIRVNAVAPGVVAWPDQGPDADPDLQARYLARTPLARAGTPDDAAEAVRWLALDAAYTTGQVLRVDGGRSLA